MTTEKKKNLIEALNSIGYDVMQIDYLYQNILRKHGGDIEILLWPVSKVSNPFLKEILIKLTETLSSLGYGIVTYDLLNQHASGEIKLILERL